MEEIFSYNEYDQVLCVTFNENENLVLYRSSNRFIEMNEIKTVSTDTILNKEYSDISMKSLLLKYLETHSKDENQRTKSEQNTLLSITGYMKELKRDLIEVKISIFDKSQILFCLPIEWTKERYRNDLRELFLEAGWIINHNNKNCLVFSTFVERAVIAIQRSVMVAEFERERKYLFCHIDKTSLRLICFQMQSAKELIIVSKKLAASDFFLTPTVLENELICLSTLESMIYSKVKRMIIKSIVKRLKSNIYREKQRIHYKNSRKLKHSHRINQHPKNDLASNKSGVRKLIGGIIKALIRIYSDYGNCGIEALSNKMLWMHPDLSNHKSIQNALQDWTVRSFVIEILNDPHIQQFIQEVSGLFKSLLGKYGSVKDSPEGIQGIILYTKYACTNIFCRSIVKDTLLNANVIDAKYNEFIYGFIERSLCEAAMQKPYKMVQIANTLSPPILWNENSLLHPNLVEYDWREEGLLQSNSFYVQCHVYENHINFILNKVVAAPSTKYSSQKSTFTVQERTINIENIIDTACDITWNHFQTLDFENYENRSLQNRCGEHHKDEVSVENYVCFSKNVKMLMNKWFQDKAILSNDDLDSYTSVSISNNCDCVMRVTYRMLMELAVKPAVNNIARTITSTLVSNDLFGLYDVPVLVITSDLSNIFHNVLKESVQQRLHVHQRSLTVFFNEEDLMACKLLGNWIADVKQILGKGDYIQLSSTSYIVRLSFFDENFNTHRQPDYNIVKKYDNLAHEGVSKSILIKDGEFSCLEIFMPNCVEADEDYDTIISWFPYNLNYTYPLTFRILPQHYSSAVKIAFSYVTSTPADNCTELDSNCFDINETLVLKQQ